MINGMVYDFESVKVLLPTGMTIMLESISYKDQKDDEVITGINGLPVGVGRGEYSGTCDIEISRAEYEKLNKYAAASGGFYNMPPQPIVVTYGHVGQPPITDQLMVRFNEREFGGSKGDKNLNIPLKGVLAAPIISNGTPAYIPT